MSPRTVHLAVLDTLADWEPGFAVAALNDPQYHREPGGFEVRTVGVTDAPVRTMGGLRVQPDVLLADLDPDDSAMLLLPGAHTWGDADVAGPWTDAARAFLAAGTPVAAICGATVGLAAAGLLDDRDHTGAAAQVLGFTGYAGGGRYRDTDAVNDRGLITAGPTDPVAWAREILAELDAFAPDVLAAWAGLYETKDPAQFHALMAAVEAQGGAAATA